MFGYRTRLFLISLALFAANSLFTDGYLTTPGATPSQDWLMIEQAGFVGALAEW